MNAYSKLRAFRLMGAFALCFAAASCGQALLTAPIGATLAMSINPPFIAAQGDSAVVSVLVLEPAGTPAPDGTVVQFFTTLGSITEQGKTNDGVARVTLRSDTRSGTAKVTAFSGAATVSGEVVIGATRPTRVIPALIDARIDLSEGRTTGRFKVTVLDAAGNPVVGVPVRFSVVDNTTTDDLLDGPDRFTDNSGDATNRVQTRRTDAGSIKIRAEVLSASALSVEFTVPVVK